MKHIKLSRRHVPLLAAFVMVFSVAVQSTVFAATVTERSIALSSSSVSATNVSYNVTFTPVTSAAAFVVDFCTTSTIESACTAPTGMSVAAAEAASATSISNSGSHVVIEKALTGGNPVSTEITKITNPSTVGTFFARIVTYDTKAHAEAYASANLGTGDEDNGSVAIPISSSVGVSGTVLETLTFCASGADIAGNCGGTLTAPTVAFGTISPGSISSGDVYTQITTNASGGAVVRLKSNATDCGGLLRAGAPTACDIAPAQNTDLSDSDDSAKFGVKTSAPTDPDGVTGSGTYQPVDGSNYNTSTYALNFAVGNATGVTSPYGDPFLDTDSAPINNKNMKLTFGVTVGNNTPAGSYSTDLNLIATGKF